MKQQSTTSKNQPNATFVCSTLLNDFLNDDASSRFDFTWNSRNYRESSFARLQNRNRSVEYRLSMVNTLIMDCYLHRLEKVTDNYGYSIFVHYSNLEESLAILKQAKEIIELTLELIFNGSPVHYNYALLGMSLLYKVYDELNQIGVYYNPKKELKHLLSYQTRM